MTQVFPNPVAARTRERAARYGAKTQVTGAQMRGGLQQRGQQLPDDRLPLWLPARAGFQQMVGLPYQFGQCQFLAAPLTSPSLTPRQARSTSSFPPPPTPPPTPPAPTHTPPP